jgi:hypothetical protein
VIKYFSSPEVEEMPIFNELPTPASVNRLLFVLEKNAFWMMEGIRKSKYLKDTTISQRFNGTVNFAPSPMIKVETVWNKTLAKLENIECCYTIANDDYVVKIETNLKVSPKKEVSVIRTVRIIDLKRNDSLALQINDAPSADQSLEEAFDSEVEEMITRWNTINFEP